MREHQRRDSILDVLEGQSTRTTLNEKGTEIGIPSPRRFLDVQLHPSCELLCVCRLDSFCHSLCVLRRFICCPTALLKGRNPANQHTLLNKETLFRQTDMKTCFFIVVLLVTGVVVQADDADLLTRLLSDKPFLNKVKPSVTRK